MSHRHSEPKYHIIVWKYYSVNEITDRYFAYHSFALIL